MAALVVAAVFLEVRLEADAGGLAGAAGRPHLERRQLESRRSRRRVRRQAVGPLPSHSTALRRRRQAQQPVYAPLFGCDSSSPGSGRRPGEGEGGAG